MTPPSAAPPLVLVIGGRGFIGGHICRRLLLEGYGVRVLSSSAARLENLADLDPAEAARLELFPGDPGDAAALDQALKDCRHMIHAGIPYPIYSLGWQRRWPRERAALRAVLHSAERAELDSAVFLSVSGTVGLAREGLADESLPYRRPSPWTSLEMKHLAEQEILAAVERGLPAVIVNPCLSFGDHDTRPSSGQFLINFVRIPIRFLDDCAINAVDVRDVAHGAVAALRKGRWGERYLLGGENMTVRELARRTRRLQGLGEAPTRIPEPLLVGTAWLSELAAVLLRRPQPALPMIGVDILRYGGQHYCLEKARRELGLNPGPVDAALERALRWFREHRYL